MRPSGAVNQDPSRFGRSFQSDLDLVMTGGIELVTGGSSELDSGQDGHADIRGASEADIIATGGTNARLQSELDSGQEWSRQVTFANGFLYRQRKVLAARAGGSTLMGFLFLVDETQPELRSVANGGYVANADGWDIRFESSADVKLEHDLQLYSPTTGHVVAWVRIPSWSLLQQYELRLYVGNPAVVAPEYSAQGAYQDYVGVWDCRIGEDFSASGIVLTQRLTAGGAIDLGTLVGPAGDYSGGSYLRREFSLGNLGVFGTLTAATVQAIVRSNVVGERRGIVWMGVPAGTDDQATFFLAYVEAAWANNATKAIQFQWRTSASSNYIVSHSDAQTTSAQMIHATWQTGQVPKVYIDGVVDAAPSKAEAGVGTGTPATGDLFIGAGPGGPQNSTNGWNGLIDEVRIRATALSAAHIDAEAANWNNPLQFYGSGPWDSAIDINQGPVAVPDWATTQANTSVLLDVLANDLEPEGQVKTISQIDPPTPSGTAALEAGKIRVTPTAGFSGWMQGAYRVADQGGKSSLGRWAVNVASALPPPSTTWSGPNSGLAWYSGSWSDYAAIESLRTNSANGKVRKVDSVQLFLYSGSASRWPSIAGTFNGYSGHSRLTGADACPSINVATALFAGGATSSQDTDWASRIMTGTWPTTIGSVPLTTWISPRVPRNWSSSITSDSTRRDMGMEVWEKAALGHFDHWWRYQLKDGLVDRYLSPYGLLSRRVILRPAWELDQYTGNLLWGAASDVYSHSIHYARAAADAVTIKDALQRYADVARDVFAASNTPVYLHFSPLTGSTPPAGLKNIDFIKPSTWDIIGPDYYDYDDVSGNTKPASATASNARTIYNDRWTQIADKVGGNDGPWGINTWVTYMRDVAIPANPSVKFGIAEWGLLNTVQASGQYQSFPSTGGDDDFVYIENMFKIFSDNSDIMAYESYFNQWSAGHMIGPAGSATAFPVASAAYKTKYGTLT